LSSVGYSSGGYYLFHFDSDMNILYSEHLDDDLIFGVDVIKDGTGSLWCSRADGTQGVYKLSSTGAILSSYTDVYDLGRLCTAHDYGCWFIDEGSLYKLDSDGNLDDSITGLDIDVELLWVIRDELNPSDFLWIVDGSIIKLVYIADGRIYRELDFTDYVITKLYSTKEYLLVYCTEVATGDFYLKLVGRASGGVDRSIENTGSSFGMSFDRVLKTVGYDSYQIGDLVPLDIDTTWNDNLQWNKVVTSNTILPPEEYHQLRLTLRRDSVGIDSPTVDAIYYQDSVHLVGIEPGESKTLYLRISLPDGVSIGGDYTSNLRVWWDKAV